MSAQADRLLAALVRRIDSAEVVNIAPELGAARRYLDRQKATRQRKAAKRAPRVADEASLAAQEDARHREFVERVKERDGYQCQLCPILGDWTNNPLDPHHLEPGPNKQKHEKMSNTLTAHRCCHEAAHTNEAAFVPAVRAWCDRNGYPYPQRKVYR